MKTDKFTEQTENAKVGLNILAHTTGQPIIIQAKDRYKVSKLLSCTKLVSAVYCGN